MSKYIDAMKDPNDYIGSVFVWDEEKVKEIMQDIVNFTKQSDNNINTSLKDCLDWFEKKKEQ